MREKELIDVIKNIIGSEYIGDDCAYLKDLGVVVTQDSLVEGVHFSLEYMTPKQLGYKSAMVNLSDVYASGSEPKYMTISLSLPKDKDENFVKEFYEGIKSACGDVKVVGGDITGADRVFVSICVIGKTNERNISSRSNAKEGYKVVVSGLHGLSAAGLSLLKKGDYSNNEFVKAHLEPEIQGEFALKVSGMVKEPYGMMDTSDGLMDALSAIANESGVLLEVDFDKISYDKNIEKFENWQNMVLFGGEDYGIVAVVPEEYNVGGTKIGKVKFGLGVDLIFNGEKRHYSKEDVENKVFNHFNY
ncbi:thiamine-phosphate kinase [bacterium]|nr:thiamine-phosphate kinase [bacterium]